MPPGNVTGPGGSVAFTARAASSSHRPPCFDIGSLLLTTLDPINFDSITPR
jgi:hypothetical protein